MAISGGDGSIILTTKVDQSGLKKGIGSMKKFGATAGKAFLAIGVAAATATVAITKMAVSAYADYEQLVGGVETLFGKSSEKMLEYANQAYKTAGLSANAYMETATSFSASLLSSLGGDTEKAADYANRAIIDMSDNANKMGTSMESIQYAYQGFAKQNYTMLDNLKLGYGGTKTEMERLVKDASKLKDVQAELGVTVDANSTSFGNIVNAISVMQKQMGIAGTTADEAERTISGSLNMLKSSWQNLLTAVSGGGNLDTAIQNLVYSLEKYLNNIIPVVERMLIGIGYAIERIAPILVERIANALVKAIPSLLAAVYQMIIGIGKGIYQGIVSLIKGETTEAFATQSETIANSVENQEALTDAVEETNDAVKKGVAGFDEINILSEETASSQEETAEYSGISSSGVATGNDDVGSLTTTISDDLAKIMGYAGAALVAIGLILLLTGNFAWGIGFIIAGAASLAVSIGAIGKNNTKEEAEQMLLDIMLIAGSAMLALGIILLLVGQITPLSIGLVVAGAGSLAGAVAINPQAVGEKIQKFFQDNAGIIAGVSLALLVIGILLCFTHMLPLAIGLIVAGVAGLAATVALNWNAIKEKIVNVFNAVIDWIKTYGLLVLGILLCLTGAGIPLGIALIIKWAKDGAEKGVPLATAIVDKVKEIWKAVKDFWNKYIAPVFTGKFWLDLAIKCANGLISGFENGVNGIIGLFEKMINWIVGQLNKISFDVPDWVPIIGGKTFGFNIPEATFKRISIPRLAQGAVIPPNREFLAVLGDQKQGRNLEAPESLLREIYAEGNAETNALLQQLIQVMQRGMTVNVDGQQLMRINRDAETRSGRQTVTGGFANAY